MSTCCSDYATNVYLREHLCYTAIRKRAKIVRTSEEVIDLIIKIRKEKAITLSELAKKTGIAKSTLSRYENKSREFPLSLIGSFAQVLGESVSFLLGLDDGITGLYRQLNTANKREVIKYVQHLIDTQKLS